jgi:hypothetical protein
VAVDLVGEVVAEVSVASVAVAAHQVAAAQVEVGNEF